MKNQKRQILITGALLLLVFAVWTLLIGVIDVQPIGPKGTECGFAAVNLWVHEWFGVHMTLYVITDWLGVIPVLVCVIFAVLGFAQLIKRKSFLKVDRDLILLGVYYLVVIICYLVFERFPVNYRPVLIEGRLEASYPSSTTLLVLSVMPTLVLQSRYRLQNVKVKRAVTRLASIFSLLTVIGRLVSGVHWVTDIMGAVLLSAGLFCIYRSIVLSYFKEGK